MYFLYGELFWKQVYLSCLYGEEEAVKLSKNASSMNYYLFEVHLYSLTHEQGSLY